MFLVFTGRTLEARDLVLNHSALLLGLSFMLFCPFLPKRGGFRHAGTARAFLLVRLVRVADDYALIPCLTDVTDRGAAQEREVKERFVIKVVAATENTFFGSGNLRRGVIGEDELAIPTVEPSLQPFEAKAVSREADGAGYEHFFLDTSPPNLTFRERFVLKN